MSPMLSPRLARPEDAPEVTRLLALSYSRLMAGAYEASVLAAAVPLLGVANPTLLASGRYFLAFSETGVLTGCGGWSLERPWGEAEQGLGHVRHFAVHPDHLGRGIGRALFDASLVQARQAGVTRMECYASLNAEGFYRALGFRTVRPMEVQLCPGLVFPAVAMRASL